MEMRLLKQILWLSLAFSTAASADFLPPDQAFQFQASSVTADRAELSWKIAEGYYLYHDQLKVRQGQHNLSLVLPVPEPKDDPNFGLTQVHYHQVTTHIPVKANQSYQVEWQGCAESGLCYPVQRITIQADAAGLFPTQNSNEPKKLIDFANSTDANTAFSTDLNTEQNSVPDPELSTSSDIDQITEGDQEQSIEQPASTATAIETSQDVQQDWNNDQFFFNLLSDQNLWLNLLIFLGLGILLAFLPCSLPLIPILSSILVQRHKGYRAALIAGVFVLGMALVYAVMGLAVAQLGYSFQRWFQSPIFISIFAVMFVVFALNLFGAFQLSLPQGLLQRLDQWQQKQKGGTLIGSFMMGMIAALIVGPCMSAPLAGALLFVSQLNQPVMGATYLFVLGLGIGLPLFIACVFGSQYLPKPGVWMDRLKFSFGFVMLALAVYFLRPLLPSTLYFAVLGLVLLALTVYLLWKIRPYLIRPISKVVLILLSFAVAGSAGWHITQAWEQLNASTTQHTLAWKKVRTQAELNAALDAVQPGQNVVIDVYADWCVACQPIEHEVLPRHDVQNALENVVRIQLDLTHYDASQDILLKQWQILGPPTMIFLNSNQQEQRALRLTGTFTAGQLLSRLAQLPNGPQP